MLAVTFCVQGVLCRADDLQTIMHVMVGPPYIFTKGPQWESYKKTLAGYGSEQVVLALIAEIDIDRGSTTNNLGRDIAVYDIFRALDLPPALLCQELDKPQSAGRKASLIFVLRNTHKPGVVQALLRQLGDRRTVTLPRMDDMDDGVKPHPYRVCDAAFNALIDNVDAPVDLRRPKVHYGARFNDEIIQEGITKLKLTRP